MLLNVYLTFSISVYRNIISTFEKEREHVKKSTEQAKKHSDSLIRERDLVRKELIKCNSKKEFLIL